MRLAQSIPWSAVVLAGIGLSWTCYGSTISFADSVPFQSTNWTKNVTVSQFNPAWGTLNWISFELDAYLQSTVKMENKDSAPADITATLKATITLSRPGSGSPIISLLPLLSVSDHFPAFDLLVDYAGTSGKTYSGLTDNESVARIIGPLGAASDMALFTGSGTIALPVTVKVKSAVAASGNYSGQFISGSSAEVTVTYGYTAIPAPAAVWTGSALLTAVIVNHVRRRVRACPPVSGQP